MAGFGQKYGLEKSLALQLGRALGAGMGQGNFCGAVCGAYILLGLIVEAAENEQEARYKSYDLVRTFNRKFVARKGSLICRELLGVDLGTEAGFKEARERNLFRTVCPGFVREAAEILRELSQSGQ